MKDSICPLNSSLKDVLVCVNSEPAGIAFIVDDFKKFKGVLTDGDVRRLLIKGYNVTDSISDLNFNKCVYAYKGDKIDDLIQKTNNKIRIIPILNKIHEPVDYFRNEHKTFFTPVAEPKFLGNELKYVNDAMLSTWISSKGKYIDRFEKGFSKFCEVDYGVSTSNGTVAIHLALLALGIGKGDEVIIPDLTFAATINAVIHSGAKPVIVDVDIDRWTISPNSIKKAVNKNTKAIIPVHIYGQPCEMDKIMTIASEMNLFVIEDCAEAHGATFNQKKVGSFGNISTFSFFGNKIITTGEGGMCVTNSSKLNNNMRILRDHGMSTDKKYWHDFVGYNYRMTNIQAAIGCAQLENINKKLGLNQQIENAYKSIIKNESIIWQNTFSNTNKVVWLVCAVVEKYRDDIVNELLKYKIDSRPFFYPLSSMPIYRKYSHSNKNSLLISKRGINLPTVDNVDIKIINMIFNKFYS